ncbi:TPA: hypothetical protein I9786_000002 [Serratia marcescens]|nr:hypothetical protein [Serratia marcescens]HAT5029789.1 hypothetical protein [Serratia marcescens]
MTTHHTNNPVEPNGSTDPRDLYDNAQNLDVAVNSITRENWLDRLNRSRKTWFGMEQHFSRLVLSFNQSFYLLIDYLKGRGEEAVASIGWQEIGDWYLGLKINNRDQVVWFDNAWYKYIGVLPHTIAGGSPNADGGVWSESNPNGKWVNIGDASLRSFLRTQAGARNVMTESKLSTQEEIDLLNSATPTEPVLKTYLTFIDDDTRAETYTYWNRLANEMGVKITLAVVPNWVNGNHPSGKATMTLPQLHEMYDAGHDMVSHGYNTLTIQEHLDEPDVLYTELHDARQWLIDNGFTRDHGYNNFVWPQGLTGDELTKIKAKSEVRKYYKYAVNAFTPQPQIPPGVFDSYDMYRAGSDGTTSDYLTGLLDQAIAVNGWMILLSHAWHATDIDGGSYETWSSRYRELINYARANNVEIVTLSQGLKIRGNTESTGEWLNAPRCNYVNIDGSKFPGSLGMTISSSARILSTPVTSFNRPSESLIFLQNTHDTITARGGYVRIIRGWPNFSYREYSPLTGNFVLRSAWNESSSSWQAWVCMSNAKGISNMTANQSVPASATKVLFNSTPSVADDNLKAFDPPNSRFVAPFAANISFTVRVGSTIAPAAAMNIALNIYKNGSLFRCLTQAYVGTGGGWVVNGSTMMNVVAGDIIEVYVSSTQAITLTSSNTYSSWQYAV